MKKKILVMMAFIAAIATSMMTTSCENIDSPVDEPAVQPTDLPAARITETIRKEEAKATVYNIEYPSADPFGKPTTLSGSIIVGDEIMEAGKQAKGMVLYNHFTVFQRDECPSHGDLAILLKVVGSSLIAVAPDYYGFGATEDKNQAYCLSRTNAQASVDCLLAARELLADKGFAWGDLLFNLGYSQGAQTSLAVLRYCTEQHPEIKFTHTVAGGGPYDIGETYRQLISAGETSMPSTVISVLLAYNQFYNLGIQNSDMFLEPTLSNIPTYLLSKDYKREELEPKLATPKISNWVNPELFDFNSSLSKSLMDVFEKENLSKGWTPRPEERIVLVHNTLDACVPYANTTQMANFFKEQGLKVDMEYTYDRYEDGKVFVFPITFPALSPTMGTHETGALPFISELTTVLCHYLEIKPWFTITPEELEGV